MKRYLFFVLLAVRLLPPPPGAAEGTDGIGLLWNGSWETEKNLTTRYQIRLELPASGLGFRLQLVDRRPASSLELFMDSFTEGGSTALSGGVYHAPTDSRLLYGMLKTEGLPARIKNPAQRGAPFAENHVPSQSGLKTDVSTTARPVLYLYGGSPDWNAGGLKLRGFAAVSSESEGERGTTLSFSGGKPAFQAGAEAVFAKNGFARLEGYYTEGRVPEREQSSWFSFKPALPERDFRLYAGSLAFSLPAFGFAADGAWSQMFAYGGDFYGNAALRLGNRPWRFSLALDGLGSRYVSPDGDGKGAAELRLAAKAERRGKRGSLLRFDALCRASETAAVSPDSLLELAENPNRASLGVYYRFPQNHAPAAPRWFSLKASMDGRDEKKDSAGAELAAGLNLWQLSSDNRIKLSLTGDKDETYGFESLKLHESLTWNGGFLQCKAGFGCTVYDKKDTVWDASLSAAIKAKYGKASGWFKAKLDSPNIPDDWRLTLSWLAKY